MTIGHVRTRTEATEESAETVVRFPADGQIVDNVPDMTAAPVKDVKAGSDRRSLRGRAGDSRKRQMLIEPFRNWLSDNEKRLLSSVQDETGRTWSDPALGAIGPSIDVLNYYAQHAEAVLATRKIRLTASR